MNEEMIEEIKNQVGSNGQKGWPVAARDRIAYPALDELVVTDAGVGLTFLWTMRNEVVPKLNKEHYAIATNFYTPAGIPAMVRNIRANPFIRNVIMFGGDQLNCSDAIHAFFERGVNEKRGIDGFGDSVYFDNNIPLEEIERVKHNVKLIDLNRQMERASLEDKITEANRIATELPRGQLFAAPRIFDYEKMSGSFPYEGGPLIVHGKTIPETWVKVMHAISRYGIPSLMNQSTDRREKEVVMVATIHDSQNEDLTFNPFLDPITLKDIEKYRAEILSPELPEGKAYTYGHELRAFSSVRQNMLDVRGIGDVTGRNREINWEFKGVPHNLNILYDGEKIEIDQIGDIIDVLKRDYLSKACVAITWHPELELMRKAKSSPCMVLLQPLVSESGDKVDMVVYFRSHDMARGWPLNAYGCAGIQRHIAEGIGAKSGLLTIISASGQIYDSNAQQVKSMLEKNWGHVKSCSDRRGNFLISTRDSKIYATLTHPDTGEELEKYEGITAQELRDKISASNELLTPHAIYVGTELARAETALQTGQTYVQG